MITPEDVEKQQFTVKVRGYAEREVDDFLDRVAADYRGLYDELYRLRGVTAGTQDAVALLVAAQKTHDSTVEAANTQAGQIVSQAERLAAQLVAEAREKGHAVIGELESERRALEAQLDLLRAARRDAVQKVKRFLEAVDE